MEKVIFMKAQKSGPVIGLAAVPVDLGWVFVFLWWESGVKVGIFPHFSHFLQLSLYCCALNAASVAHTNSI